MSMQRFSGKAVVVTGAAQGIGRGVALAAAEEGAKALLVDRAEPVSYTHLRAHETSQDLVCRLLLEKKKLN